MTNITIPIQEEYLTLIDDAIKSGAYDNRSQFIRNAIKLAIEKREIDEIHEAARQAEQGEAFQGDLDDLVKKYA